VVVVAALLGEADHGGPCEPHDIRPVPVREGAREGRSTHPRGARGPRPDAGSWARFQVSWGEQHGADPRRLLAVVCRRGDISSADVGAITIGGRSSMVEVNAELAGAFASSVRRPDPRDPRIKFREWRTAGPGDRPR
jgi:ATP-dependent RNA helicase DeaD